MDFYTKYEIYAKNILKFATLRDYIKRLVLSIFIFLWTAQHKLTCLWQYSLLYFKIRSAVRSKFAEGEMTSGLGLLLDPVSDSTGM